MRSRLRHGLSAAAISAFCTLVCASPAFAANMTGNVESVKGTEIQGWAMDTDNPDKSAEVVLYVYADGSTEAKQLAKVTADQYRSDLEKSVGDGDHAFTCTVNWDELTGSTFIIEGYALTGDQQIRIGGSLQYSKAEAAANAAKTAIQATATGPAGEITGITGITGGNAGTASSGAGTQTAGKKGNYLGSFTTTAYCNCTKCSGGSGKTYSGTIPKANHTISADISRYPIGTKLMIGDIIYTVEDIGTGVYGNRLDIYFDTHQQALDYGMKTVDVYAVE